MKKLLCIIGSQRSGTTALQTALSDTGVFYNFSEIFHTTPNPQINGAFLPWCKTNVIDIQAMSTDAGAVGLAERYLNDLDQLAGERCALIDVKLNSWQVLGPFWRYAHEAPFFMRMLEQRGAAFVFLSRRNLLEQVLSGQIAQHTQKWHDLEIQDLPEAITTNWIEVREQARNILLGERHLYNAFLPSTPVYPVSYEDLFDEQGSVQQPLIQWLAQRFPALEPTQTVKPSINKNQGDKRTLVVNYAEMQTMVDELVAELGRVF
jgi:LPS sulfotransferase NodH